MEESDWSRKNLQLLFSVYGKVYTISGYEDHILHTPEKPPNDAEVDKVGKS